MSWRRTIAWLAIILMAGVGLLVGCGGAEPPKSDAAKAPKTDDGATDPATPATSEPPPTTPPGDPIEPTFDPADVTDPPLPPVTDPVEPGPQTIVRPPVDQTAPEAVPPALLPEVPPIEPPTATVLDPPPQPLETNVPEIVVDPRQSPNMPVQPFTVQQAPAPAESEVEPPPALTTTPKSLPIEMPETSNPLRSLPGSFAESADMHVATPNTLAAPSIESSADAAPATVDGLGEPSPAPFAEDWPIMGKSGPVEMAPPATAIEMAAELLPPPDETPPLLEPIARPAESPVESPMAANAPPEAVEPAAPETSPLPEPPTPSPDAPPVVTDTAETSSDSAEPAASSTAVTRDEGDYAVVEVFYATDRAANDGVVDRPVFMGWLMWTGIAAGVTLVLLAVALRFSPTRTAKTFAGTAMIATVLLALLTGYAAMYDVVPGWKVEKPKLAYRSGRGKRVELGTCEVSIPKRHEVGVLEAPSIFELELQERPQRHVVLLDVERVDNETFYRQLRERVGRSPDRDTFIFIHGYNVSFEDAARRTAQIAYDLEFPGAPIFYSWPSQSSITGYTIDENNVEWTVPHLRDFLTEVVARSGAEKVHLVAHSMGNRALANALRGLSYRRDVEQPMFNHVVLTAPDIDADVFRRDLAPRIVKTAERVTLYASSNDTALAYSKTVHGYPRAGDTGEDLVVVEGIDTIDVSAVDTSLLSMGHLYYGSSQTVIADLIDLIRKAKPPEHRPWLRAEMLGSLTYWVFERIEAARNPLPPPR